jgi:hypothetical protein
MDSNLQVSQNQTKGMKQLLQHKRYQYQLAVIIAVYFLTQIIFRY